MEAPPLHALKCPARRPRGINTYTRCGCLVVPGEDYAYCHTCGTFFRVIREEGKPVILKKIDKKQILFQWLLCEYEEQ
jgi:hypothetical protein